MQVDTHAHAHFNAYKDDYQEVIQRSLDKGTIINLVGTQSDTSKRAVEVAEMFDNVYASVGLHPEHLFSKHVDEEETTFLSREESCDYEYYKKLCSSPKVIAIGECGLDYYRLSGDLDWQRRRFRTHIRAARECGKPLVIHTRSAAADTLAIMREERAGDVGGGAGRDVAHVGLLELLAQKVRERA